MARTIIEQALASLASALAATPGVAAASVFRNRRAEVAVASWPALNLVDGDGDIPPPDQSNFGIDLYTVPAELIGYVGAASAAGMSEAQIAPALDALWGEAVKAALADITLGGLAVQILVGHTVRAIDRDSATPQAQFSTTFEIEIATAAGDPFNLPH